MKNYRSIIVAVILVVIVIAIFLIPNNFEIFSSFQEKENSGFENSNSFNPATAFFTVNGQNYSSVSGVIIPLYLEESSAYSRIIQARASYPSVPIIVIINPDSGPAQYVDQSYVNWITQLQSAGVSVVGYVYTGYGYRNSAVVKADIDKYKQFYPTLDGIFYDEMAYVAGQEQYYQTLLAYSKTKGFELSVGNPGIHTTSNYISMMDVTLIYEDDGLPSLSQYQNYSSYDNSKLGMIPLNVPTYSESWVNEASEIVGWIYVTNDRLDNPWDTLSSHFEKTVETLNKSVPVDSGDSVVAGSENYLIVDLVSWGVSYMDSVPSSGWTDEYKTTKLVLAKIPSGTFVMGSPSSEAKVSNDIEENQVNVTLTKNYYMSIFEITQGQYQRVMGFNPSLSVGEKKPVENVSYSSAISFANTLKSKTNNAVIFNLPTESRWERACRAGTTTANYNGNAVSGASVDEIAWSYDNSNQYSHDVGLKKPNQYGLYDMIGNVGEWVLDYYALFNLGGTDPIQTTPREGNHRVIKGGCYLQNNSWMRCADKGANSVPVHYQGFRIVGEEPAVVNQSSKNYLIVDLVSGSSSYFDSAPSDLLSNEIYKTTKMVLKKISKGTFTMGTPTSEPGRFSSTYSGNESPQHTVTLSKDFYMSVFEVTRGQWNLVNSGSVGSQTNYPIYLITWDSIRGAPWPNNYLPGSNSFIGRLKQKTDLSFDLPTEAQWEYACRAGTTTGLNTPPNGADYSSANVTVVSTRTSILDPIQPVGTKTPNNWGLYDMHGNVAEFVLDWISRNGSTPYSSGSVTDPVGISSSATNKGKATRGDVQSDGGMSKIRCGARSLDFAGIDGVTSSRQASDYGPGFRVVVKDVVSSGVDDAIKFCSSLPAGAVWNDNGQLGTYYGDTTSTEYGVTPGNCRWKCRDNYSINSQQSFCIADTKLADCNGPLPANALWGKTTNAGQFVQTWNGNAWIPLTKNTQHNSTSVAECVWRCDADNNYSHLNGACVKNARSTPCSVTVLTANAEWNDNGNNGFFTQTLTGSVWSPSSKTTAYSETANDCKWKCKTGFYNEGSLCVVNTRLADCSLSQTKNILPENAIWTTNLNAGKFIQTKEGALWVPFLKKAFYSEDSNECAYKCKEQSKGCEINPAKYCGAGISDCNEGYWGECKQGNSVICSTNQYCNLGNCTFCTNGTKNCDANLLNGCETPVLSDVLNCGACGNECASSEFCIQGECLSSDANACANVSCGANSSCAQGGCVCSAGYSDCDSYSYNGCEKVGSCVQAECVNNNDCSLGKNCVEGKCVLEAECTSNSDCDATKNCVYGNCVGLLCDQGLSPVNHSCVCEGTLCGEFCFAESGICCNGKWNEKINSCEVDYDGLVELINESKDKAAANLFIESQLSLAEGLVTKAKAESELAEFKAKIAIAGNKPELVQKYQIALAALDKGDYEKVSLVIFENEVNKTESINPIFIGIIAFVLIALAIIVFKQKK